MAGKAPAQRKYRIMVVDDHPVVRLGLVQMISRETDLEVCAEAEGTTSALAAMDEHHPDLVLVDISLKDGSGLDLIKQVRSRDSSVKILVSSMHDESLFAERALRAGAMGYVNKSEAVEKTVTAIRQILGGAIYLSPRMTDRMLRSVAFGEKEKEGTGSMLERLSDRELEVFELIGRGLTTRETAERLHLSVKTVETYRENIKMKLNLENNNELICRAAQWALKEG